MFDLLTLAEQAQVHHRNAISHAPGSRGVRDFLREALRVIKVATDLMRGLIRALFWYRTEHLSVFGLQDRGKAGLRRAYSRYSALQQLARGRRRRMILTDLDSLTNCRRQTQK